MEKKVSIKTPDSSGLKDMVYAERDTLHQEELNFKELDEGMSAAIEEVSMDSSVCRRSYSDANKYTDHFLCRTQSTASLICVEAVTLCLDLRQNS